MIYQKEVVIPSAQHASQPCVVADSGWTITLGMPANAFRLSNKVSIAFLDRIVSYDHYLTTTYAKAHEASSEKASRAFYIVFIVTAL